MKKILISVFVMALGVSVFAQTDDQYTVNEDKQMQTILGDQVDHGGYGAFMMNYSQINGSDAFLFGIRGGWMIDHVFTIGLGGYGFINNVDNFDSGQGEAQYDLAGGYGGLLLEATILPSKPVHLSFPVLIGAGGVAALESTQYPYYEDYYAVASDAFFVIEPGVELELSLVKVMRLGFAVTYRYTADVDMVGCAKDGLNGFNYGITMKFGSF